MSIKRVVPDITSDRLEESRDFYAGFLGFDIAMDMGWIITFVSPTNPTAQVSVVQRNQSPAGPPAATATVEVEDVDVVHKRAVDRGLKIVYPLTDEPWGVRRFFVTDPNGVVLNVMSHRERTGQ
jgi:predicted enzyme related to lactoylglutathione lyase